MLGLWCLKPLSTIILRAKTSTCDVLHILLQIKKKGRFERSVLPLELKTGRATFSMEHKGQVGHVKGQGQSYFSEFP